MTMATTDTRLKSLPDEQPLEMPVQELWDSRGSPRWPSQLRAGTWSWTLFSRALLVVLTLSATAAFTWGLYDVLQPTRPFFLLIALIVLSTACFAWVAFGSAIAVVGAVNLAIRGRADTVDLPSGYVSLTSRNALLFPVYHEDPREIRATIRAIADELAHLGQDRAFDVFVLSDTRAGDDLIRERKVLADEAGSVGALHVFYRNRAENAGKKAGNIADWVTRFGNSYDHFVIFDADSIMSGDTLVRLARAMEDNPRAGLIQTVPRLVGSRTLFARMQQYAHGVYGPLIAAGYAAWQGASGNYWGHNAIIRTRAFAQSAGLPKLVGPPPFGGSIQSHDFVEAAMLRRNGWGVHMVPSAGGSFERCPPTLIDMAVRDRRWAQGNLQHARIVTAHGLPIMNRLHMLLGIFAYLASGLWCLTLLTGLWLTAATEGRVPKYFPADTETLFPDWPKYDPQAAFQLLLATAVVLFVPKILGLANEIADSISRGERRTGTILAGGFFETLLSMLLAPVLMLTQIRSIAEILAGRDSGWNAQTRAGARPSLATLLRFHGWHMAVGALLAAISFALSWDVAAWMSPIYVGLLLAPLLTYWSSGEAPQWATTALSTREDVTPPDVVRRALHAD